MNDFPQQRYLVIVLIAFGVIAALVGWGLIYQQRHLHSVVSSSL